MSEQRGKITDIFIAPDKGEPMQSRERVRALAGWGLEGDRYAMGLGAFSSDKRQVIRHVTLIEEEAISESDFSAEETRRNIVTRGINLNELIEVRFVVDEVWMRGVELCDPCGRPSKLSDKPGFKEAFDDRGGLRAEVLSSGIIEVNAPVYVPGDQ